MAQFSRGFVCIRGRLRLHGRHCCVDTPRCTGLHGQVGSGMMLINNIAQILDADAGKRTEMPAFKPQNRGHKLPRTHSILS